MNTGAEAVETVSRDYVEIVIADLSASLSQLNWLASGHTCAKVCPMEKLLSSVHKATSMDARSAW